MKKPNEINVLIACEESQRTCIEFRKRGFNAFSCDIQECSGGHPEWHILCDVLPILNGNCRITTQDGCNKIIARKWDLIIAHPPCTYLTVSGNGWFNVDKYGDKAIQRMKDREDAAEFFMKFVNADCDHIAIENPIGYMNSNYRKPNQIIHPYYFGDPVRKSTCLWMKNLPLLLKTNVVNPEIIKNGDSTYSGPAFYAKDENGKILSWNDPRTAKERSKTYPGVAKAFAEQWGTYLTEDAKQ